MRYLLIQFDLHQRLFNNVLDGFSDEESNKRLNGSKDISHVKYLAGHLLNSNYVLALTTRMKIDIKWNELFAVMGLSEAKDNISYPSLDEIMFEWNELYPSLRENLEKMSTDVLDAVPPTPFDQVADSCGELWAFVNHHVAYHIGQIGILRKAFNKGPMSYE